MRLELKEKINLIVISLLIIWVSFVSILSIFFIKGDAGKIKEVYSIKNIRSIVDRLSSEMDNVTTSAINLDDLYMKNKDIQHTDLFENNIDSFYVFNNNNIIKQVIIPDQKDNLSTINPSVYLIESKLRVGLTSINGIPAVVNFKKDNGGQTTISIRLLNKQRLEKIYSSKENEVIFSFLKSENKSKLYELGEITEKNIEKLYILYDHKDTKAISDFIIKDYFQKDTVEIRYNFDRSVSPYIHKSQSKYIILMVMVSIILTCVYIYILDTKVFTRKEKNQHELDGVCENNSDDNNLIEENSRYLQKKSSDVINSLEVYKEQMDFCSKYNNFIELVNREVFPYEGDQFIKEIGKNNYKCFKEQLNNDITSEMIKSGIENGEIDLYFQPTVNSFTNEIEGVEVLTRWFHPNLGYISPLKLIKAAEDTGYINTLGKWILNKACSCAKELNEACNTKIRVAVNISSIQLMKKGFINEVKEILNRWQLNPRDLELEITKDIEIYNCAVVISKLEEINELGVGIVIDNFSIDNSSFKYLQQYKVDTIKLDRSIIKDLEKDNEVVKSTIELSHMLGFKVVAKGVENFTQAERFSQFSCDCFQGYFFYKPMPFGRLRNIMEKYQVTI